MISEKGNFTVNSYQKIHITHTRTLNDPQAVLPSLIVAFRESAKGVRTEGEREGLHQLRPQETKEMRVFHRKNGGDFGQVP